MHSCIFYFGQKDPIKVPILSFSSALVKIYHIAHFIFQATSQFFFRFSNFIYFQQKEPIKVQSCWNASKAVKSLKGVMTLKGTAIFKEKLIVGLKNDLRNLINFHTSSQNFKNLHFNRLVLSKACKVLDEKFQKSYASWHWKLIQRKANS